MRGSAIRGFPYALLVRVPLVAHLLFVPLLIRYGGRESSASEIDHELSPLDIALFGSALFMMSCWFVQLIVVPLAIQASWRARTLCSWRPNLAIACGCMQIAMLIWMLARMQTVR